MTLLIWEGRNLPAECRQNFGDISQSTAEILLKRNGRHIDFHFCITISMSFCICLPNFVQIVPSTTYCSYDVIHFSRWRPSAILNFLKVTADHPRSANEGLSLVLKFRLDRIYSFEDIIFMLLGFGLTLPIYVVVSAAHVQYQALIYFRGRK